MRSIRLVCVAIALAACSTLFSWQQERTVAITVDDLPHAGDITSTDARTINRNLLAAFKRHHVPVTGFVIQTRVEDLGLEQGASLLKEWIDQGLDLGNHSYSHPEMNNLSVEQIEDEIVRGEATFAPLMRAAGRKVEFFRFPEDHTGDTKAKHDAVAAFLAARGYKLAVCTIDNEDYVFNAAYTKMLANRDDTSAQKLRAEYLAYTGTEIDYYAGVHRQVLGYEPPHVMLLHANVLNSELIEQVLDLFEKRRYKFVTLDAAQSDAAYQTPEFVTKGGMMWGYRWAAQRKVKVDGSLETEPPQWITDYGKKAAQQ